MCIRDRPEEPEKTKEETMQEQMDDDPLLAPLKPLPDWMSDVPFDTAKLGADGEVIPGAKQLQQEKTISTPAVSYTHLNVPYGDYPCESSG